MRSPAAAEPPIPAITTTRGRFVWGSMWGSMRTAARHCAGKPASTSHARCGSIAVNAARSSSRRAGSLTIDVSMDDRGRVPEGFEELAKLFDEGHGAVAPAGASDGHGQVRLALTLVERQQEAQQVAQPGEQLPCLVVAKHELTHLLVPPVERTEPVHEVRVRQEPHVEDEVGVEGDAVLVAEGHQRRRQA